MAFPPNLLIDDWADAQDALVAAGWTITAYSRYRPTHLEGVTPSGKAFTFDATDAADGSITGTLTIAGNTKTATLTAAQGASWAGSVTSTILTNARAAFPVAQR